MEQRLDRIQYLFSEKIAMQTLLSILKSLEPCYQNVMQGKLMEIIYYIHATHSENCAFDHKKAIAFIGPTGTGKTLLFNAISEYMKIDDVKYIRNGKIAKFGFDVISSRFLVSRYQAKGFDAIEPIIQKPVICIDDVGSENMAVHFGNKIELFEHVIEERYMTNRITHFTSNLNPEAILERYGERVYSRIMEKTNFMIIEGKDWRL